MNSRTTITITTLCTLLLVTMTLMGSFISTPHVHAQEEPALLPGVKVFLAQEGLDILTDRLVDMVVMTLLYTPIDDVEGVVKIPVIGEVEYSMTDIKITSAEIKGFGADLHAPNMISIKEDSILLGLQLNWAYKKLSFPKASGKGDAVGTAKDTIIHCKIAMDSVQNKPHLTVVSDKVELGELDIKIRGGTAGWILDMLQGLFKTKIREAAARSIRNAMIDAIDNKLNQIIAETSFVFPLGYSGLAADARIAGDIVVTDHGFLAIGSKAEILDVSNPKPAPYTPQDLPSEMIIPDTEFNLYISEYPALSAGFAALSAGHFEQIITPDVIPENSPIQLDTTSLRFTLPDLHKAYPDRDIVIKTHATKPPMAKVTPDGMAAAMNITASFFIVEDDKSLHPVFDLGLGAVPYIDEFGVVSTNAGKGLNITGHVASLGVDGRLEKSYMGEVDVSKFVNLIKILTNSGLLSQVNKILAPGYPVPLPPGLIIEKAVFRMEKGFVAIAGSVDYTPPAPGQMDKRHQHMAHILEKIDLYNKRISKLQDMVSEIIMAE